MILIHEETFTFTPAEGEPLHIYSGRLRAHLLASNAQKFRVDFPVELREHIVEAHGVDVARANRLTSEQAAEPVIIGIWPEGTHILIDGAHRRYYWALHSLAAFVVPHVLWSRFTFDPSKIALVMLDRTEFNIPRDTDELLNIWFDFDEEGTF